MIQLSRWHQPLSPSNVALWLPTGAMEGLYQRNVPARWLIILVVGYVSYWPPLVTMPETMTLQYIDVA